MNSAEKIKDRLGSSKTVEKTDKSTWDKSDARDEKGNEASGQALPLDAQMGTGAADAGRALLQLSERYKPAQPPKPIAWDFGTAALQQAGANGDTRYLLPKLKGGSWVSATLVWDRVVDLNDKPGGTMGQFDPGESFTPKALANLDLFLVKKGDDPSKAVWASTSTDYNVEHIYFQLAKDDQEYELVVRQKTVGSTPYAIAWWAETATEPPNPQPQPGLAWNDLNRDGVRDANEPAFTNVRVDLHDATTNAVLDTRYTDANGEYQFTVDQTGQYYTTFTATTGYAFSTQNVSSNTMDTVDSDVNSSGRSHTVTSASSAQDWVIDAGLSLVQGTATVGGRVWEDLNGDGVQDVADPGRVGVTVALKDLSGNVVQSTTTGTDGSYSFASVSPGNFSVAVTPPAGYTAGSPVQFVSVYAGDTLSGVDVGMYQTASVGGRVWSDVNGDGIQNTGEAGTGGAGALVQLLNADGTILRYAFSDSTGVYSFDGLLPGTYAVRFVTPSAGYVLVPKDRGSNDTLDSDADPRTGRSELFGLTSGAAVTQLDGGLTANTPPQAVDDAASTNEDNAVTISVLANDTDPEGDLLSILETSDGLGGTTTVNADGTVTYTPNADFNGTDTFTYVAEDAYGRSSSATVTVTVHPVNDAPVAADASVTTPQNTAIDIDLRTLVTDVETAPASMTFAVSGATNGTVTLLGDGHTARFTPNSWYHGSASFTYTATDTGDGTSAAITTSAKTVTISVNSGPTAADVTGTLHAGGTTMPPLAWTDPDGDMVTITSFTQETEHGRITGDMMGMGLVYTAKTSTYNGIDTFTYTISDGHGGFSTGTVTLTLTNTPPTATSFDVYLHSGGSIGVIPMYSDADGDMVTLTGFTQGQHGSVTQQQMMTNTLTYQAASPTYVGLDSFDYTVNDGHGGEATGRITLHLTNQAPTAWNVNYSVYGSGPFNILPMYSDPDGDIVTVTSVTQPPSGQGTVSLVNGQIYYAPPTGFTGTVVFYYTVDDGHGGTATATITLTVS